LDCITNILVNSELSLTYVQNRAQLQWCNVK